jgi:hypothetical protein
MHHLQATSARGATSAADADTDDAVRLEALFLSADGGEPADETERMRALLANSAGRYRTMVRVALTLALSRSHTLALPLSHTHSH